MPLHRSPPVPDAPTADLAPGFYWISLDGLPPEVARRDAEAGEWLLIGSDSGIVDGHPAELVVLSGPLVPDMPRGPRRRPLRAVAARPPICAARLPGPVFRPRS